MLPRFALPSLLFAAGLTALSTAVSAETAPPETASETARDTAPDVAAEPATADPAPGFLGVAVAESIAPPDADPRTPRTVLVVSHVQPDSPADAAGLRSGDLLLRIDGQVLLHPVQLQRLVMTQTPGQAVTLTVFRDGETQTLDATLGERPASAPAPGINPDAALVDPLADRPGLRLEAVPHELQADLERMRLRMDQQFEQMRRMFQQGMDDGWPGGDMWERGRPIGLDLDFGAMPGHRQVTVLQDNDHRLTITGTADGRHLQATDAAGEVLYDGPIDTPEQLDAVPDAVREKIPTPDAPGMFRMMPRIQLGPDIMPRQLEQEHDDEPGERIESPVGRAV